jgi:hypothetical protein
LIIIESEDDVDEDVGVGNGIVIGAGISTNGVSFGQAGGVVTCTDISAVWAYSTLTFGLLSDRSCKILIAPI